MAGLGPAIHAFASSRARRPRIGSTRAKSWMPGPIPGSSPGTGMTRGWCRSAKTPVRLSLHWGSRVAPWGAPGQGRGARPRAPSPDGA